MTIENNGAVWKARDTAQKAALKAKAQSMRNKVLTTIRAAGGPVSPEQVADALNKSIRIIRPRFRELTERGLIEDTGERGQTHEGRSCILWRATPPQGRLF